MGEDIYVKGVRIFKRKWEGVYLRGCIDEGLWLRLYIFKRGVKLYLY